MPSYQDIETRLNVVEDKLHFIMTAMRMKGMISSGLVGPDGQPTGQVVDHSLLEWYRLVKQQAIETVQTAQAAPVTEQENG